MSSLKTPSVNPEENSVDGVTIVQTCRGAHEACRNLLKRNTERCVAVDIKGSHVGVESGEVLMISVANSRGVIFIFDVYSNLNMLTEGALGKLLAAEDVTKVVYMSEQPSSMVFWRNGFALNKVFDLQLSHAILCGSSYYGAVVSPPEDDSTLSQTESVSHAIDNRLSSIINCCQSDINKLADDVDLTEDAKKSTLFCERLMRYRDHIATVIDVILVNKILSEDSPEIDLDPVIGISDILPVDHIHMKERCSCLDRYRDLFKWYNMPRFERNPRLNYKLATLKEFWRHRPITNQMKMIIKEDLSNLLELHNIMTEHMDDDAKQLLLACSHKMARTNAPCGKSNREPSSCDVLSADKTVHRHSATLPSTKSSVLENLTETKHRCPETVTSLKAPAIRSD